MRILLVNKYHYLRGGAERAYFDMAHALEQAGHEVGFFSMEHPDNLPAPFSRYFVSRAEYREVRLSLSDRLRLALRLVWNREAERKMQALLQAFQPDVVHLHNIYHQLSPSILRPIRKAGIPMVMTLHDYKLVSPNYSLYVRGRIWEHTSPWRCLWDRAVHDSFARSLVCALETCCHRLWQSYRPVDVFLAPSRFLARKYLALGFRREIGYLPNILAPAPPLSLPPARDERLFLYYGRLSSEKGADLLLHAWPDVRPPLRLRIVGAGPEKPALQSLARQLGIEERIEFSDPLYGEALAAAREEAQAVIIPSRWYENMPYVLLESLQAGCVVLAADRGGIPERIRDRQNGFLFDPEDPEALAERINSLAEEDLAHIRIQAAQSVTDLAPGAVATQLSALYERLISEKELAP